MLNTDPALTVLFLFYTQQMDSNATCSLASTSDWNGSSLAADHSSSACPPVSQFLRASGFHCCCGYNLLQVVRAIGVLHTTDFLLLTTPYLRGPSLLSSFCKTSLKVWLRIFEIFQINPIKGNTSLLWNSCLMLISSVYTLLT